METKKLLTTLVVFAVVLAAMSTIIEAQRGGSGGSSGGGHHWSVNAGSDNDNVGDNNNVGNNAGDNNNAGIEASVSTDKRVYVLGEPIEITVTAYNPTEYPVGEVVWDGCFPVGYIIDGYITQWDRYVDENGTIIAWGPFCDGGGIPYVFQPDETRTETFTRYAGTILGDDYVPLPVGRHSIVGTVVTRDTTYESDPITIRVTDSNNGGM